MGDKLKAQLNKFKYPLLALVLGRRADASGFDAAVATSSVVPLLFEHAHVLLTGCGDARL